MSSFLTTFSDFAENSRRERDSNPWNAMRSTVFETAPFDHSGISPQPFIKEKQPF